MTTTASEYAILKDRTISLIKDLRTCESTLLDITIKLEALGAPKAEEHQTEIEYLRSMATWLNVQEFQAAEQEARDILHEQMSIEPQNPLSSLRARISGALSRAAEYVRG